MVTHRLDIRQLFVIKVGSRDGSVGIISFFFFVVSAFFSQLVSNSSHGLALVFFLAGCIAIAILILIGKKADLFYFFFFISLMRITIPGSEREIEQFLPIVFFTIALIKSLKGRLVAKKNVITIILLGYFAIAVYTFYNGIILPGSTSGNTGFLARLKLLNTVLTFSFVLLTYRREYLPLLVRRLNKFYFSIIVVGLLMLATHTYSLPLFNTFSWKVLVESATSRRMGILGEAGIMAFILHLSFGKKLDARIILLTFVAIFLSGGRSNLIAFLFLFFSFWGIKNGKFLQMVVFGLFGVSLILFINFSGILQYVPGFLQRLFILFPSEFYDSNSGVGQSAAAGSSSFRYLTWLTALPEITDNFLFGEGFSPPLQEYSFTTEGFATLQKISPSNVVDDLLAVGNLHNTYLSIAYIMGIPALFLFISLLLLVFKKTYYLASRSSDGRFMFYNLYIITQLIASLTGDIYLSMGFFLFLGLLILDTFRHKTYARES